MVKAEKVFFRKHGRNLVRGVVFSALLLTGTSHFYNPAETYNYHLQSITRFGLNDFTAILEKMDSNDTLNLTISSFGGSLVKGAVLMDQMESSEGYINVRVEGYSMSMGTMLMMAGDTLTIGSNSGLLFHLGSSGDELMALDNPFQFWGMSMMESAYGKYLTLEEKVRVIAGEDVVVLGRTFMERVEAGGLKTAGRETLTFMKLAEIFLKNKEVGK